ncbi:MAG: metallophosphoesterase [Nitrososphaerales archaeon]
MLLVQISDIHCGPQFRKEVFDEAVKEINGMKPHGVIVTGDLTEDGLVEQYQQAKEVLDRIEAEKIFICSGNHDYRSTGYYLFRHFFQPQQVVTAGDTVFVSLSTARPERDDGEAGFRQIMWLKRVLTQYKDKRRVVAMHHHVLPVPDTGTDRIRIVDAGDLLRVIARSGVDLVLCGHRHRPWIWRLEDFIVVNAGTLSSKRTRGFFANSYNIIEILDSEIRAHLKVVGGKKIDLRNVLKHEYLHLPPIRRT